MPLMPKSRKRIDNSWLIAEMAALGLSQADLARGTGISADKVNKSIRNTRGVSLDEYALIKAFLERFAQKHQDFNQEQKNRISNNIPVKVVRQEGKLAMPDGLSAELVRDLIARVRRLEEKVEEMAQAADLHPQKGRRG